MIELEVLKTIQKHDPKNEKPCIQLLSWFDYRNHVCMVFEKYGLSLYDFMKKNRYRPFPMDYVREFAFQILESVSYILKFKLFYKLIP